jgi:hypothetical protein
MTEKKPTPAEPLNELHAAQLQLAHERVQHMQNMAQMRAQELERLAKALEAFYAEGGRYKVLELTTTHVRRELVETPEPALDAETPATFMDRPMGTMKVGITGAPE